MKTPSLPLWYLLSLRPAGQHAVLRPIAARAGGKVIALSPWQIQYRHDDITRNMLTKALNASHVLCTSPVAVQAAAQLMPLKQLAGQHWLTVGAGTANSLKRHGIKKIVAPARMDSEGLLALPEVQSLKGMTLGLITAPGGRGLIAPTLQQRGARLIRADVYERISIPLSPHALQRLHTLDAPACLAVSSSEAFTHLLSQLPDKLITALQQQHLVAASSRLAQQAIASGFIHVTLATGPQPAQLVIAAAKAVLMH